MNHLSKIKRIKIMSDRSVVVSIRQGFDLVRNGKDCIRQQTGEVFTPLYGEYSGELVGFIG